MDVFKGVFTTNGKPHHIFYLNGQNVNVSQTKTPQISSLLGVGRKEMAKCGIKGRTLADTPPKI